MKKTENKSRWSNKKFALVWSTVLAVVLILLAAVNIVMNIFSGYVDLFLGGGEMILTKMENSEDWDSEYYPLDYKDKKETQKAADALVEEIESEGIVLLKNNGTLPLASGSKVTLLGRDAADPVYGGSGSGSVKMNSAVTLWDGLEASGFILNESVFQILKEYAEKHPKGEIAMDKPEASTYYIGEMPTEYYTEDIISSFSSYGDAAIVMIGRGGGEGGDLTQDMKGWDDNYIEGQHQLELNQDEKDTLELAKKYFDKVIVLINASTTMELGLLEEDEEIDAVCWIGSPGQTGFYAVGNVIAGMVNPSGRTVDIYPADLTKDPSFVNFGHYQYSNISKDNAIGNGYFVQYEEGIYSGYRYYETAATESFIDYDTAVVYPFGYGLSYTQFEWTVTGQQLEGKDGVVSVEVNVANIGETAGKEVVQLYYSAPYYKGGIEKAAVVLGDFAKTKLLAPGESQTLTLSIKTEDMASYDYKTEKAYVLEAGDYEITLRDNSHTVNAACPAMIYHVDKTRIYAGEDHKESDFSEVTNQFDDVSAMFTDTAVEGYALNMSRADFAATFPTAPQKVDFTANETIIAGYQAYRAKEQEDPEAVMPATKKENGLTLIDMRGLDYDDPSWELLLDQLSTKNLERLILNGMYGTVEISSVGKPETHDYDGPAGISSYMTKLSATAYPSEVVIASTWNLELAEKMGAMLGNEAIANGVTGWYAPAMNLHRSPFGGRNFEYYSEDPLISGKMGSACVEGTFSKGVYATVKHFAANEQETNRQNNGISVWVNEQALRELYLKPFEYTVKHSQGVIRYISDAEGTVSEKSMQACTALMSSFNRLGSVWAGGSTALMDTVLRKEWKFEGLVITDFNLNEYMYPNQSIAAGSDLTLSTDAMKSMEDTKSATAVSNMRKAAHNILYTAAHSNAMNHIAPGTIVSYTAAPWRRGLVIADIIIGSLVVLGAAAIALRCMRHKAQVS